jgi:thymidylate synthase
MKQYLDLMRLIRDTGIRQPNRTGIDTLMIPGAMLSFNLEEGFPLLTTKKMYVKQTIGELIAFARGSTSAKDFRELGCTFWDANANKDGVDQQGNVVPNQWLKNPARKGEDDLGRIYGAQWRDWKGPSGSHVDQVQDVLTKLVTNPTDRRMIINAWRPDELNQMALPPCHVMHQFLADTVNRKLHLCMYQRSNDFFLGNPHNIASYAMWLTVIAALTDFTPGTATYFMADTHLYVNHLDQVEEQLSREPKELPRLVYSGPGSHTYLREEEDGSPIPTIEVNGKEVVSAAVFDLLCPEHFTFEGYDPHPAISAPMAV